MAAVFFLSIIAKLKQSMKTTTTIALHQGVSSRPLRAAVETIIWRVRLYWRWLIITTMAAPNPMMKGGEA